MAKVRTFFVSFLVLSILFAPSVLFAQDLGLEYGQLSGLENRDIRSTGVSIINVILSFLGILFVGLTVFAGFKWMTSAGSEEAITSAKKTLTAAVIGLAVVLLAYSITNFVLGSAYEATVGPGVF